VTRTASLSLCLAALWALAGTPAAAKGKAKTKPKADIVALRFAWPSDLSANVTYQWTRTKSGKPPQEISAVTRLVVAGEGKNLRVVYRDWHAAGIAIPASGTSPAGDAKIATIVDRQGAFVRVDGTVSADDARRIAEAVPGSAAAGPSATKTVAEMIPTLSRQQLENLWQMLVGTWADVELEIGGTAEIDDETPLPFVPGTKLKRHLRYTALRFLECPGRSGKRCVELKVHSEPDRESMAKAVEAMGAKFGTKGLGSVGDMHAVQEVTLVTEPGGLIPYRLEITKTVGAGENSADGTHGSQQVDRTLWTFSYAPAPTGPAPH